MKEVKTEIIMESTAELKEQVEKELQIPDPETAEGLENESS